MVKRVTIIKIKVNKGSGDSSSSGKVKNEIDTMEVTNVVMADARKGRNLVGKRQVRIQGSCRGSESNGLCGREGK